MTERTLSELAAAEIVPDMGGENAYLARFGEQDYDSVNKSAKNTLLLKDRVAVDDNIAVGDIMVDFDLENDEINLHGGDDSLRVPEDKHENVLWAVYDEDGGRLHKIYDDLDVPTVRQGLMDQYMPRFRRDSDDIRKTESGWLLDDILISWDGSNSPANNVDTHIVSGGKAVPTDDEKEVREISMPPYFDVSKDEYEVTAPDGRTFELDGVELLFLTTVGLILDRNPENYDDALNKSIENSKIVGFTDTKSGLYHSHPEGKHRIQDLGVTDECADMLWSNENDHTPLHEMALREQELKNAPIDIFEDADNDNTQRWNKIHFTSENASIPKDVRSQLEKQFV